jgi:hypothetical protein
MMALPSVISSQAQARHGADPLARLVTWVTPAPSANDSFVVTLPPSLDSAIQLLFPGFRLRTKAEVEGSAIRAEPNHSIVAIATDLDGDGKLEAVLWGVLKGRGSPEEPVTNRIHEPRDLIQSAVILGVRQSATGFLVTKLFADDEELVSYDGHEPRRSDKILSEVMLLPSGKWPGQKRKAGLTHWIIWQDGDCKKEGHQWTVRNRKWIHSTSYCSYGD